MSGRAGRRGLDDKGIVIAMIDEKMDTSIAKGVLLVSVSRFKKAFWASFECADEVAEWLRRWTANPLCSARVGSNPILVVFFSFFFPQGLPDPLNSAFHLTYNMVLNLLRVEEINPEFVLERSFYQFQNNSSIPSLERSKFSFKMKSLVKVPIQHSNSQS